MAAGFDRDQFALRSLRAHSVTHQRGLIVRNLIVLCPVKAEERRHTLVNGPDRSARGQLFDAGGVEFVYSEKPDAAAVVVT